ncbi:hypothetical protein [Chamaesiphon sp.]
MSCGIFNGSWEFYISDETAQQLTPEEAYFQLKRLVDRRSPH